MRPGEVIKLGEDVTLRITSLSGPQVRIEIDAPPHVDVRQKGRFLELKGKG